MIARLRARERTLLAVGLGVLTVILLTLVLFFPQVQKVAAARRDAGRKQAELARATALAQQESEIERQHAAAKAAAESLAARIPTGTDLPDLIIQLDEAITISRVVLLQISFQNEPAPATGGQSGPAGPVASLPVQLRVRGSYPQLRALVEILERSSRLILIDRLALAGTEAGILSDLMLSALYVP